MFHGVDGSTGGGRGLELYKGRVRRVEGSLKLHNNYSKALSPTAKVSSHTSSFVFSRK